MTPDKTPTSRLSPQDAAAYWLARHDARPSTAADPVFLAWLAESESHATVWARAQTVWGRASLDLQDDPLAEALRASALAARPAPWPKAAAVAACVAVAVLLGAFRGWRHWGGRESDTPKAPSHAAAAPVLRLATHAGERRNVTLEDGTRLDLDSDTRVDVAFNNKSRRLTLLKGRTYIEVERDPSRPFAVDAGDQTIVDRGTAFGVRLDAGIV
jgi:transmembrane sensor